MHFVHSYDSSNVLTINFILQIKVSQIECDALWRAPEGCTQFFTSESGTIYSYGFPNELQVT